MNPSCWFHRHPTSSFRKRQILSDTGSCGSCFNNVQYRPGWNIPTQSDCLINLDDPYPFWRWCPAIQSHSGSAPRIHAHRYCLLLDAFPSLLGPNQSPSQERNTKYGKYAGSLFTVPMVPEFNINPQHCQSQSRKSSSRNLGNLFSRF